MTQEQLDKAWEREEKRAAQEKHKEKYWSEIEDGIVSNRPVEFIKEITKPDINFTKKMAEAQKALQIYITRKRDLTTEEQSALDWFNERLK